jgi:uncharacterized protein (DUF2147 family)
MTRPFQLLIAAAVAALGLVQAPAFAQASDVYGVWRNPKNSVHVEVKPCGQNACGYVVWASPKALRDAQEAGSNQLVGLQIFREMTPTQSGDWKGKVFVPDLNRTFSGRAEPIDATRLRAKGCLVAGVVCKSQIWTRAG